MENKFRMILDDTEEIIWCNHINVFANTTKTFFKTFLFGLFPPVAILMLGVPYSPILLALVYFNIITAYQWIVYAHFAFSIIVVLIYLFVLIKDGKNTYCCITNKRIIKRSGAFHNDFSHYSLKNIGNVEVAGGIFDCKGDVPSANLIVLVKDFHLNTDGNAHPKKFVIPSLNDVYEAYKLLTSLTEGYNEVIRIKNED